MHACRRKKVAQIKKIKMREMKHKEKAGRVQGYYRKHKNMSVFLGTFFAVEGRNEKDVGPTFWSSLFPISIVTKQEK
jgi:hypothetical protein